MELALVAFTVLLAGTCGTRLATWLEQRRAAQRAATEYYERYLAVAEAHAREFYDVQCLHCGTPDCCCCGGPRPE